MQYSTLATLDNIVSAETPLGPQAQYESYQVLPIPSIRKIRSWHIDSSQISPTFCDPESASFPKKRRTLSFFARTPLQCIAALPKQMILILNHSTTCVIFHYKRRD